MKTNMARRSKTVIPTSKREWNIHSDDHSTLTSNLTLQFRSHTIDNGGFKKENSFYNSYKFNENYRKPIRFLNFNRPKTALYVGEAFSTLSPRRGLQSPISTHSKEPSTLGKDPYKPRVFLTQDSRSREATSLFSHPGATTTGEEAAEDDYEEDDEIAKRPKPGLVEIQRLLYKRECTKLGITPVGKFLRDVPGNKLLLRHYNLGCDGARALAVPLILDATITTLDLEGNDIGSDGLASMAEMLGEHCAISTLNLRGNSLGSRGAAIICKVLLKSKTITSLDVAANNFADKDGLIFAQILKENRQLTRLNLADNSLGELSGKALGDALVQNDTLEELDLQWNKFSGKGAAKLLTGVKENIGLKKLNLSFNSISLGSSKATGTPLGDALTGNSALEYLNISGCHLLDLDMISVAKGLKVNDTLETLRISHNLVQVQSVSVLIKALATNESSGIKMLDFGDSAIEENAIDDVEALRQREIKVIHGIVHQSETDFEAKASTRRNSRKDSQDTSGSIGSVEEDGVSGESGEGIVDNDET